MAAFSRATGRAHRHLTKTKRDAARVAEELVNRGFAAAPLHGDLNQVAREQALKAFRTGKVDILVATTWRLAVLTLKT